MQKEQELKDSVDSFLCLSFSTYTSDKLADIADHVTRDHLRAQNDNDFDANDDDNHHRLPNDDNDFEFVAFRKAADEVFFEGYAFPIFNSDLVMTTECESDRRSAAQEDVVALQFPMAKLSIGDEENHRLTRRDPPSSSSSSESEGDDDLERIPAGTYCVWTPNTPQASPSRCKKSHSTGSSSNPSKRWKLLDLLRRSNSDGKDRFVFLTPSSMSLGFNSKKKEKKGAKAKAENSKERSNETTGKRVAGNVAGGKKKGPAPVPVSAHEALYVRNRELRRVDKKKSYLPYRQDLVGFFARLNGMGRAFAPF